MHKLPRHHPKPPPKPVPKPRHKKPGPDTVFEVVHETRKLVKLIMGRLAHVEALLEEPEPGGPRADPAKVKQILKQVLSNKAKLSALLEVSPLASDSGEPPKE